MKVYLAGPMRGIPQFNYPAFFTAADWLRKEGHTVFSPAERDIERHGGINIAADNHTGDEAVAAAEHGFDRRKAMADDTAFICNEADAIALLPGWENSSGANAEWALAKALGLTIIYLGDRLERAA